MATGVKQYRLSQQFLRGALWILGGLNLGILVLLLMVTYIPELS